MKHVEIYTDGACSGNPGKGGYGAVLKYGEFRKELSEGFLLTTNNRMELLGAITALKALKEPCHVTLYSDSKYVIDALSLGWAKSWREKGWRKSNKEKALNPDLWEILLNETDKHEMEYVWVKGHAGNPENERCDELAVSASGGENLKEDLGYIGAEQQTFE
ncbi:MAG: ribonuclease HI [Clostridia bacterium]|nr:ribonuclease HI [Clostridia bacterium]